VKRLAQITATVLATIFIVYLLWQFRSVVMLFLLSLVLAAVVRPATTLWENRPGQPAYLAGLYLLGVIVFGLLVYFVGGAMLDEIQRGGNAFVTAYDIAWRDWPEGSPLQQSLVQWMPPPNDLYSSLTGERLTVFLRSILGVTMNALDIFAQLITITMLSLYWGIDRVRFERLWLSLLPVAQRAQARALWRDIEASLGAYVRSQLVSSLLTGALLGVGYWLLGMEFPATLAILSAIAWLIPWLGALLVLVPVVMVAMSGGPGVVAVTILYTVVVFILIRLLESRLLKQRYGSLVVVVVMVALVDGFGLIGLLLAPPLAAALQVVINYARQSSATAPSTQVNDEIEDLQLRLESVRMDLVNEASPAPDPQAADLTRRLTQLLQRARNVL
jgi:predicted PurR-regulated permease PerM